MYDKITKIDIIQLNFLFHKTLNFIKMSKKINWACIFLRFLGFSE